MLTRRLLEPARYPIPLSAVCDILHRDIHVYSEHVDTTSRHIRYIFGVAWGLSYGRRALLPDFYKCSSSHFSIRQQTNEKIATVATPLGMTQVHSGSPHFVSTIVGRRLSSHPTQRAAINTSRNTSCIIEPPEVRSRSLPVTIFRVSRVRWPRSRPARDLFACQRRQRCSGRSCGGTLERREGKRQALPPTRRRSPCPCRCANSADVVHLHGEECGCCWE